MELAFLIAQYLADEREAQLAASTRLPPSAFITEPLALAAAAAAGATVSSPSDAPAAARFAGAPRLAAGRGEAL
jgi:hypothetical protein